MRRNGNVSSVTAAAVLLAFFTGCATPRPVPAPQAPVLVPVTPPTVTVEAPPVTPPLPPVSVGPREPARAEPPPPRVVQAPPVAAPLPPSIIPPTPPAQRGKFIVLNFDNADIETVIHAASEIVGFNYVIGPGVGGKKITVQTSGRIPQEEVFGVLLAILEVHGVTAVKAGNLYKIVPMEGARERAVPTIIGSAPESVRMTDEVITQIVPIRFGSVSDLGTLLRPLISARGTLIANRETNVLIITDASSNIRRLLEIIQLVDVAVASDELQVIQVNYADATELATLLNQIFASGRVRSPAQPGAPPVPPTGPLPIPGAPPAARPGPAGETGGTERPPLIIADKRSNVLLVQARKTEVETIRRLVSQLDINVTGGRRVFIYYAENAKAKDLASTLNAIYGGKETVATSAPTPSTTPRRAGEPPTPPPPPPTTGPGGPIGGTLGATDVALVAGQFRFIADETTNAIIVSAVPRDWADIELTIKQLDKMPRQVLIEVLVAEITLNEETKLGLDWALRSGKFSLGQRALGSVAVTAPADIIAGASTVAGLASGLTAFTFAADQLFAIVNALATEGRVNVISSPHIMTSENKKAVINVSASIPIVTTQQTGLLTAAVGTSQATGSVNQTVEYRDAGVVLTVTPRIGERGTVALDVKQEVNDVGAPEGVTQSPRINKREAETSVVLINNQTLVLGGLITDTRNNTVTGIPLLSRIPIIGWIFGFKDIKRDKRELIILITPRVIGTALDAARITDEMRRVTPELDKAIRNAPRPPTTAAPSAPPVLRPAPEPTSPTPSAPMPPPSSLAPVPPEPPSGVPVIPPAPPR